VCCLGNVRDTGGKRPISTLTCVYTDSHPDRDASGRTAGNPPSRAQVAYADLKHRLLQGEFPLNVRLGEERLAALVGVSRTPIREALSRLEVEGLVARAPDGGFLPVVPDVTGMRQLYEVRVGLELQALRRPSRVGATHDRERLEALRADWLELTAEEPEAEPGFVLLDESFHLTLAESAGNPMLVDVLRQINERIRIVRMQDFLVPDRVDRTISEHLALLDAVLAGDVVEAESQLVTHIDSSVAVVEERVTKAIARMAGVRPDTGP
jgi:DNA-binding GntR family transcriptional regulator